MVIKVNKKQTKSSSTIIRFFDSFGFVANRHEFARCLRRSVWSIRFNPDASFRSSPALQQEREKPTLIEALLSQSAVEAFDESIVGRLAGQP